MKILLISRFNVPNIGDLVISNMLYKKISKYGVVTKYNLSGNPYIYTDINDVESSKFSLKFRLISLLNKLKLNKIYRLYVFAKGRFLSKRKNSESYLPEAVSNHDIVIIGGGNMLMSLNRKKDNLINFRKYIETIIVLKKPVIIMDIGIGPFYCNSHLDYIVDTLNCCDKITFRDKSSYNLFIESGGNKDKAFISIDPAFLYEYPIKMKNNIKYKIGLNIIDPIFFIKNKSNIHEIYSGYLRLITALINKEFEVILFVTTKEDQSALEKIFKNFIQNSNVSIKEINGLNDLNTLYNSVDLLIGTRMHSMIIAYTMHVPIIGLSWQEKIRSLFKLIEEEDCLFDLISLNNSSSKISKMAFDILRNESNSFRDQSSRLKLLQEKATINDKILREFINR